MSVIGCAATACLMATSTVLHRVDPSAVWAGTVSFDDPSLQTVDASLNVSVRPNGTASFSWAFTRNSVGTHCAMQLEPALLWSVNGSQVTALGDSNEDFYTFQGTVEDGVAPLTSITGSVCVRACLRARPSVAIRPSLHDCVPTRGRGCEPPPADRTVHMCVCVCACVCAWLHWPA
jgi:hypothetical protein